MIENISQIISTNCANNQNICKMRCSNPSHSQTHDLFMVSKKYICEECKCIVCKCCIMQNKQKCIMCLYHPKKAQYCKFCDCDIIMLICNNCGQKIQVCEPNCANNITFMSTKNKFFDGKNCTKCYLEKSE